jgi:hypothetical protein
VALVTAATVEGATIAVTASVRDVPAEVDATERRVPDREVDAVRVTEAVEERDEVTGDDDGVPVNDGSGPGVFV